MALLDKEWHASLIRRGVDPSGSPWAIPPSASSPQDDPFPLPFVRWFSSPATGRQAQRVARRRALTAQVNDTIAALNLLYCCGDPRPRTRVYPSVASLQSQISTNLFGRLRPFGPPPDPVRCADDFLGSLAALAAPYGAAGDSAVVPLSAMFADHISLPSGGIGAFEVFPWLSGADAKLYSCVDNFTVPPQDAEAEARLTGWFHGIPEEEYPRLVQRMLACGMVTLGRSAQCVSGVFGVWKKRPGQPGGPSIRLIIDLRRGNCSFVRPEPVELCGPGVMSRMRLAKDEVMVVSKLDLDNFFYRCRVPVEWQTFFGLPLVRLDLLGLSPLELKKWDLEGATEAHPLMTVLPMGWTHRPIVHGLRSRPTWA